MLSEMVASLFAFAFSPDTPAFSDEEIPMLSPLSVRDGRGSGSGGIPAGGDLKSR